LRSSGGGASLLIYAPIDTHIDGDPEKDLPWVGPTLRADMLPKGFVQGDLVYGLGAANPKGMFASLAEIDVPLREASVPIKGDLQVGFAGGGMPASLPHRRNYGMSDGVYHLRATATVARL